MKRFAFLLAVMTVSFHLHAENIPISASQLPSKALKTVLTAFPNDSIAQCKVEKRASLVQYEVRLADGTKLQFSKDGSFTECVCTGRGVPDCLIPQKIQERIRTAFPDRSVLEIEHDGKLFELKLDDGTELSFNSAMRLIDIDYNND